MSKSIFDFFKKEENKVVFSEVKTIDGIVLQYDGELAEGTPLFVLDEEGNQIPAPEGEYQVEYEDQITDTDSRITALETKFAELLEVKESKFKDERKKVEMSKELTVKEILTKK